MRVMIIVLTTALFLIASADAGAADGYAFHIRVTDGRTGLLANPDFEKLALSEEQLAQAAKGRVVVLDDAKGTHWRWLMLSWFDGDPAKEQSINESGVASPQMADFGLVAGKVGHFRIRCLRDDCRVATTSGSRSETLRLTRGELSPDLPLDAGLSLTFKPRQER